jgi:hypothetical protein
MAFFVIQTEDKSIYAMVHVKRTIYYHALVNVFNVKECHVKQNQIKNYTLHIKLYN